VQKLIIFGDINLVQKISFFDKNYLFVKKFNEIMPLLF